MTIILNCILFFSFVASISTDVENTNNNVPKEPWNISETSNITTIHPDTNIKKTQANVNMINSAINDTNLNITTTAPITVTVIPPTGLPTSTAAPPKPKAGNWNVTDSTNTTCIMLTAFIEIDVPYTKIDNKTNISVVKIPYNANATGSCVLANEKMILNWINESNKTSTLTFEFSKNDTSKKFALASVSSKIAVDEKTFPNITTNTTEINLVLSNVTMFSTPLNNSYYCMKQSDLSLLEDKNEKAKLKFNSLQLQAFMQLTNPKFGPDIVPIIVGCTLALLVIIVLIAYLVARKRSQAHGYLSM